MASAVRKNEENHFALKMRAVKKAGSLSSVRMLVKLFELQTVSKICAFVCAYVCVCLCVCVPLYACLCFCGDSEFLFFALSVCNFYYNIDAIF